MYISIQPSLRSVQLRPATSAEVKRSCQQQALRDAQETGHWMASKQDFPVLSMPKKYDTLW